MDGSITGKPDPAEAGRPPDESPAESAPPSLIRRSLIIGVGGSLAGSFFFPLVMGDIFNRYIDAIGLKHRLGLFMAISALAATTQIFGSWILQRTGHRRLFFFALLGPPRLIWLAIITVPLWGPEGESARLAVTGGLFGLFWITSGWGGVAWMAWMRDLVPENWRGRFFAFRSILIGSVMSVWSFFAALYIQSRGVTPESFAPVYVVGVICGVVDIVLHVWVWHPEMKIKQGHDASLRRMLRAATHRGVRKYLLVQVVWCLSSSLGGLTWYHMWRGMGMEVFDVRVLGTFGFVVYLCFMPLWGYFLDHYGVKATYLTAMVLTVINPIILVQAPAYGWTVLYVSMSVSMMGWAGLGLTSYIMVFSLARREDQAMTQAVVAVVMGLVSALGYVFCENVLYPLLKGIATRFSSGPMFYVVAAYLVVAVLRACALALATRLDQPEHETPAGVVLKMFYTTNPVRALYSMGRFIKVKAGDLVRKKEHRDSNHSGRFRVE